MASINILGVPQTQNTFSVLENKTVMIHDLTAPLVSSTEQTNLQWLKTFNEAPIEITYADFYTAITNNQLITGFRYAIIDFQTIYDQMDFDASGALKSTLTTKYGAIEQIWVLALSPNAIASTAYSKTYPNDRIQYDWTYNLTLVNGSPAKGRITERIDEWNNRTDYDHREIKFIRYDDGSGNFTIINDNGNTSNEFLTFGVNYNNGGLISDNNFGDFYSIGIYYGQEFANNVLHGFGSIGNNFSSGCFNNTFVDSAIFNTILGVSNKNIFIGAVENIKITGNIVNNIFNCEVRTGTLDGVVYDNIFISNNEFSFFNISCILINKIIDDINYPYAFNALATTYFFHSSMGGSGFQNFVRYFDGTNDINVLIP